MAKKNHFYVVWNGRETGIFKSWDACKAQVDGYAGAQYKGFEHRHEAERAWRGDYCDYVTSNPFNQPTAATLRRMSKPIPDSYAVDAACSGNPGRLEYRGVYTDTGKELFRQGPYPNGTNNIGEFLAIVHALALLKRQQSTIPIYSDSEIALDWVASGRCRTKLKPMENNAELFQLIARAERWLQENTYANQILKWQTDIWGEIPADFGRK